MTKGGTILPFLIEALLNLDQAEEALAQIDACLPKARERQELYLLPELWRIRAQALAAQGAPRIEIELALDQAVTWVPNCSCNAVPPKPWHSSMAIQRKFNARPANSRSISGPSTTTRVTARGCIDADKTKTTQEASSRLGAGGPEKAGVGSQV
ncbi:hypothetical protein [Roseateles albus]|uniref:Uncharacterized protein n=1 Tax=Roseateles albus TaxID=2987525 RepID=A0ABT5KCY7_9BURK|nr:hypothetical protein [Roseateles albus]MDC8771787.1 hypothetical protein [Roseateles albus]